MRNDFNQTEPAQDLDERYQTIEVIGTGVYGTVWQAKDVQTGEIVALKRLHLDDDLSDGVPAHVIREVSLLRDFVHPNIVQLKAIQITGLTEYNLIFEYIHEDLHKKLKGYRRNEQTMPMGEVIQYSQQLLNGIHACHVRLIIHRDLKPQNILIGPSGLKICDFGLARMFSLPTKPFTHDVITLWYRAPELLLGTEKYGPEVDIWSAGCIIAEMAIGYPTFPGDSEIGTIFKIMKTVGSPTEETWPGHDKLEHWKKTFPFWPATNLRPILDARPELGEQGIDVLRNLLRMQPQSRLNSRKAKIHPFFTAQP